MLTKISSDDVYFWNTIRAELPQGEGFSKIKGGLSIEDWIQMGEEISLPKNTRLVKAGDIPKYLYIVEKGLIAGYEELANGNELFHFLMDRNAMLLESNILLSRPASVNFRTLEQTDVIRVGKEALLQAIEKDRRVLFSLFCSVSNKFLTAMEELRGSRSHSAEWMLCHLLLELAERYGVTYDGKILISKNISYQMLAGLLGVNRVTAVRAMHSLRDLGLVERINGFICVRSIEALKTHQELVDS